VLGEKPHCNHYTEFLMATTTHIQASSLFDDLKGATGPVSWQVGKIGNALLTKAQEEEPDNVALAAIDLFQETSGGGYIASMKGPDVRAVIGQIAAATNHGPSIG
jgi:hypothetical protein